MDVKEFLNIMKLSNRWRHDINYASLPLKYCYTQCTGGIYICNPYKDEILSKIKMSDPKAAQSNIDSLLSIFKNYLKLGDFVGADLTRKFLQRFASLDNLGEVSKKFSFALNKCLENPEYLKLKKEFLKSQKLEAKVEKRRFSPF